MGQDAAKVYAARDVADERLTAATAEVLNRYRALLERLAAEEG